MKRGIAGAALAAVMGACALAGGVQRAEAATLTIRADGYFGGDGTDDPFYFSISYDPLNRHHASVEFDRTPLATYPYGTETILDTDTTVDISSVSQFFGQYEIRTYTIKVPNYSFEAVAEYDTGGNTYLEQFNSTPFGNGAEVNTSYPVFFEGALVNTVPLPASLPLFGAGLLALGGAAYARRRSASV